MSLEGDIVTAIENASLGTSGTDLFRGPMRDGDGFPDAAVTVLETGGLPPVPDLTGRDGKDLRVKRVQIQVRGAKNGYTAAKTKVDAIFTALHKQAPAGYVGWECDEPIYVEIDTKRRDRWSLNLTSTTHN